MVAIIHKGLVALVGLVMVTPILVVGASVAVFFTDNHKKEISGSFC